MVGATLVWAASIWAAPRTQEPGTIWDVLLLATAQAGAVALLVQRSGREPGPPLPWLLLALGALANLAGQLVFIFTDGAAGPRALSDICYLASYAFLGLALPGLFAPSATRSRGAAMDGLIVGLASGATLCAAWDPGAGGLVGFQGAGTGVLFLAADVALLAVLVWAMVVGRFHLSPAGTLIWAALLVWGIGDVVRLGQFWAGSFAWPTAVDLAWPVGVVLIGLAAAVPDGPGTNAQVHRWAARIPLVSALLAGAILVLGMFRALPWTSTLLATATLMVAVGRQFITLSDLDLAQHGHDEARTDPLTGLLNRRGLYEVLAERLDQAPRSLGLLMVDLDGFKDINDSLGHQAGDDLLVTVADRFRRAVTPGAVVARLGGDEFAIIPADGEEAQDVAGRLLSGLHDPAQVADVAVRVQASIGISRFPDDAGDIDELIRTADVAMYMAKRDRSAVSHYRPELDPHSREQLLLLAELRNAVPAGQLEVVYQPQCRLSDGQVTSVEALLRWEHPTRGQLLPAMFIEQAESSGVICELTNFVLDRALEDLRSWLDAGVDLNLSVNISGVDLARLDLPDVVTRALERTDVEPERLTLELTETVMTSDAALAKRLVSRLQSRGVRISMDDFGIGFSSLSQALSLPLDEIKLDRSLVVAAGETKGRAILRTAVRLARAVGASVVAEGVEDLRTLNLLRSIGADYAQGFLIARPMPAEQVVPTSRTVPTAMAQSMAVVSKPRQSRTSRHAGTRLPTPRGEDAPAPRIPEPGRVAGAEQTGLSGSAETGPAAGQKDTTGGADWPSGAW